jgi:hypothetical protein
MRSCGCVFCRSCGRLSVLTERCACGEWPADFEACGTCGYDHEYEAEAAQSAHAAAERCAS